jgi:hypothetical protein
MSYIKRRRYKHKNSNRIKDEFFEEINYSMMLLEPFVPSLELISRVASLPFA